MPRLQTLKPRLQAASTSRVKTLEAKAGTTERQRGRKWMQTRARIATAQGYTCTGCGLLWMPHKDQVDHITPIEQGGSHDDANLQLLCDACHKAKTATEARERAQRR